MKNLNIPVLYGSAREGAVSAHVADYVIAQAKTFGFNSELIKVADIVTMPQTGYAKDRPGTGYEYWAKVMDSADGLIVVTPEYNHGYPGELKLAIDSLKKEYTDKPVAFVGAGGFSGGTRAVQQLRQVFIELFMYPIRDSVYFQWVKTHFNEKGEMITPEVDEKMKNMLEHLAKNAEALKPLRK